MILTLLPRAGILHDVSCLLSVFLESILELQGVHFEGRHEVRLESINHVGAAVVYLVLFGTS